MKIYTRSGDDGTTGLFGGTRVSKGADVVDAYGTVDESNAAIGVARSLGLSVETDRTLHGVQRDLFTLGAELACAPGKEEKLSMRLIDQEHIAELERDIDKATQACPELRTFVLPGGSASAAALHHARTVCRRAERIVVTLTPPVRNELVIYLNRLSDYLFMAARRENADRGIADIPWEGRT